MAITKKPTQFRSIKQCLKHLSALYDDIDNIKEENVFELKKINAKIQLMNANLGYLRSVNEENKVKELAKANTILNEDT